MKERFYKIINNFEDKRVLVVGDVMLDKYIYGDASRLSPEAPVPVVKAEREIYVPGGAGNTATNLASLGAYVDILGITGEDEDARRLESCFKEREIDSHFFSDKERPTTKKTRVIAGRQQVTRIDYENPEGIEKTAEGFVIGTARRCLEYVQAVVISDYNKGCITEKVAGSLIDMCNKQDKPIIIDPRPQHRDFYKGAYLVTPNANESYEMAPVEGLEERGLELVKLLDANILITLGEGGMELFEKVEPIQKFPAKAREVYDITGAGDTVVATVALSLASGASLEEAVEIANHAAGIVVGKRETASVTREELLANFE